MAWLQKQARPDGSTRYYLTVKNPKWGQRNQPRTITRPLGAISAERAKAEAEIARVVEEGRAPRTEAVDAETALNRFCAYWRKVLHRSEKTIRFYEQLLKPMFAFMAARSGLARWHSGLLADYLATKGPAKGRRGMQEASIRKAIVAAGTFVKWAQKTAKLRVPDFTEGIVRPERPPIVEKKVYAPGEVKALKREAEDPDTLPWLRRGIWLAHEAGLSLGDIRAVQWEEIDLDEKDLLVRPRSKTGYPIEVPITPALKEVLKAARATHGPVCRDMPEDDSIATRAFRRLCERAGVEAVGGFKRLRHTYATRLGELGYDLKTIGGLLGHGPHSTEARVYTHTNLDRKREAIARFAAAAAPAPTKKKRKRRKGA